MEAVDPNIAVGHHAVESNINVTMRIFGGQVKRLAIPRDSGREKASGWAAWIFLVNGTGNAPIMRHGDVLPAGIVHRGLFRMSLVTLQKLPSGIEFDDGAHGSLSACGKRRKRRKRENGKLKGRHENLHRVEPGEFPDSIKSAHSDTCEGNALMRSL
jgi:hypothetical protein